jgi:hypothetical protein
MDYDITIIDLEYDIIVYTIYHSPYHILYHRYDMGCDIIIIIIH